MVSGAWIIVFPLAAFFKWRFSGMTGDTYGAVNEIGEICVLLIMNILAFNHWLV